jgi:hypothetical protein
MSKWTQVGGDRDWSGVGCTLARDDRSSRSVDLVRITPWLEMDPSALTSGYGLWDVSEGAVDYEDMSIHENVRKAIKSAGMSESEYEEMSPSHKAALIAEYGGVFEESRSVSDLAKALPKPLDQVEFWAGKTSAEEVKTANQEMRREATQSVYGRRHRGGVPDLDALEFATGGEPVSVDLEDEESQALRYAEACASGRYQWQKPRESDQKVVARNPASLHQVLTTLAEAPEAKKLPSAARSLGPLSAAISPIAELHRCYARDFELDWDDEREQVESMIDDDAEAAHELAKRILEDLGFY